MQGLKILVIDDDFHIRRATEQVFTRAGAKVYTAASSSEGLRLLYAEQPNLILLDIMMPDEQGWETCRQIRRLSDVPVIMLTALKQDQDIVRGLECGADDFVSKPFSSEVLLARARAVLRRAEPAHAPDHSIVYQDDFLTIDLERRLVSIRDKVVKLTPTEFRLLAYLFKNAGRVLTFKQILENVWGWEYQDSIDYVHVYISHLRQKLEEDPKNSRYLLTEHGVGYRFEKYSP
jgi:two-component system KDP operon response regulator KdpE